MPDDLALGVAELFRQAYLIGVEVVHLAQIGIRAGAVGAGALSCVLGVERLPVTRFYGVVGRLLGVFGVFLACSACLACAGSYGF